MKNSLIHMLAVLLLLQLTAITHAAELKSTVERTTLIDGESVVLYIEGEDLQSMPDTSALNQRFEILDSRVSNRQIRSGGKTTSTFTLRFELLPKHLGTSEIPAFESGGYHSQPVVIDVVERGTPGTVPRDNVFAEITLDNESPYVQAQAVLSLHIFDDGSLATADPIMPTIADVQVEALPVGKQRLEERDGVQYRVHTWRYALFAQKSGRIEIPRLQIIGSVKDPGYGGNLILRNTPTRRISIRSKPATLEVKARPDESTSAWWLPVQQLDLQHKWSSDIKNSRVGDPLTLSVSLTTKGATSTQLPEIVLAEVDGLKMYPDVPELASQPGDDGLISQRREKWSVIPQQEGKLVLPQVTLKWWDTVADVERVTTIAAQEFVVAAAQAGQTPPVQATQAVQSVGAEATEGSAVPGVAPSQDGDSTEESGSTNGLLPAANQAWMWIAMVALSGWLTTMLLWFWRARGNRVPVEIESTDAMKVTLNQRFRDLRIRSTQNDPAAFRTALVYWAEAKWPGGTPSGLAEIGTRLGNPELRASLRKLDSTIYSRQTQTVSLPDLYSMLSNSLDGESGTAPTAIRDPLPQL